MARKKNKRARAAVASSIVAAASLAGIGTAAAEGPIVCEKCDPGTPTVVLSDHVYQKWDSLANDGVFMKLSDVFHKLDDVFIKVVDAAPVVDLFHKVEIDGGR